MVFWRGAVPSRRPALCIFVKITLIVGFLLGFMCLLLALGKNRFERQKALMGASV